MNNKTSILFLVSIAYVASACDQFYVNYSLYREKIEDDSGLVTILETKENDNGEAVTTKANYYSSIYGAGKDGVYLTGDDRVLNYSKTIVNPNNIVFAYSDSATITQTLYFSTPGVDNTWFTEDDSLSDQWRDYYISYPGYTDLELFSVSYSEGNVDREVNYITEDSYFDTPNHTICQECIVSQGILSGEGISYYRDVTTTESAQTTIKLYEEYSSKGADGLWFTEDDTITTFQTFLPEEKDIGIDYFLSTGLDLYKPMGYWKQTYSSDGSVEEVVYAGPGDDEQRFTDDDYINYRRLLSAPTEIEDGVFETIEQIEPILAEFNNGKIVYKILKNADGDLLRMTIYGDAGIDNEWLTSDDVISTIWNKRSQKISDTESKNIITLHESAGRDGEWLTDDDELFAYVVETITKGETSNTLQATRYDNQGEDGKWLTDDDLIYGVGSRPGLIKFRGNEGKTTVIQLYESI